MRFLLYNIRYAVGDSASLHMPLPGAGYVLGNQAVLADLTQFVKSVSPDIVGLVEVDTGSVRSRLVNQAESIAQELGMNASYAVKYGELFFDFPYDANVFAGLAFILVPSMLNAYKWYRRGQDPTFEGWF